MFGFIKNLITGILNFFVGLFGGKKSGYYLELDEAVEATQDAAKQAVSNVKKAAESVASNAKETAESVASNAKKATESVASNAKKATESVASENQKVTQAVASKDQKQKKVAQPVAAAATTINNGKKSSTASSEQQPAQVELVQTAEGLKAQPKSKSTKAAKVTQQQPTETTFAPKYLVPTNSNGRRRPGANMSSFLDMARQVKTPG